MGAEGSDCVVSQIVLLMLRGSVPIGTTLVVLKRSSQVSTPNEARQRKRRLVLCQAEETRRDETRQAPGVDTALWPTGDTSGMNVANISSRSGQAGGLQPEDGSLEHAFRTVGGLAGIVGMTVIDLHHGSLELELTTSQYGFTASHLQQSSVSTNLRPRFRNGFQKA
jgi:hypothetical protein